MSRHASHDRLLPGVNPASSSGLGWRMFPLFRLFSRRWLLSTLLVIPAVLVMVRLGIWQLDRLDQRRAFNTRVQVQQAQPALVLDAHTASEDLTGMEYRQVVVRGVYDFSAQVGLVNQAWENEIGVHLLTPLRIEGSDRYVLVNRGWVPSPGFKYDDWDQYGEPGVVEVRGILRASQDKPDFGRRADPIPAAGEPPLRAWSFANVAAIGGQLSYQLLPVYIQQAPDPVWTSLPYRTQSSLDLTEGPHMGYALQWFAFASILACGYPWFIYRRERAQPTR
jgi:surfeit locus 1 family protein